MEAKLIVVIIIGITISVTGGYLYDQMYDCLFPPGWMKLPRSYNLLDCLQKYADGTLPDYTQARENYAQDQTLKMELVERYKDKPEVEAFYAKYDDANVSLRDDHLSYFAGTGDDFRVRMNLYFDENYEQTNMRFYCYIGDTFQHEVAQEDILHYLQNHHCLTFGSANRLSKMCYEVFDCMPVNNTDFLSCINSKVYGRTVMDYCSDPSLVKEENGCVSVKMPWNNTIVRCS